MEGVILTALFVGGSTIFGGAVGLLFKRITKSFSDAVLSFAAGVMLAAAILGLILPSIEGGGVVSCVLGIFAGAFCVNILDFSVPIISKRQKNTREERVRRVFLFVMAIALHNLPEGIAAGVGLGTGDVHNGILIATAIALQNVPEGIIVTVAMRGVGAKRICAFVIAAITGIIEIFGTVVGYFAVSISSTLLPFLLALAGGTMLYVVSEEMIPETHSGEGGKLSTYFLLIGFALMLLFDALV